LSSFGLLSRSIGLGLRAGRPAIPVLAAAGAFAARGVGRPFRPFFQPVRSELVQSSRHVDRSAGAGNQALGGSWRNPRR
jgi:hypothetical protein